LHRLNENGDKDYFSELLLNILSIMSGFEKSMISSRQREGIEISKRKGVYQDLNKRGKEGALLFLQNTLLL
tara:strand:- start:50 stop:262 length:213 start_codon:yes stop_codon:yes gene_type:complete